MFCLTPVNIKSTDFPDIMDGQEKKSFLFSLGRRILCNLMIKPAIVLPSKGIIIQGLMYPNYRNHHTHDIEETSGVGKKALTYNKPTKFKARHHVTVSPRYRRFFAFFYPILISAYLQIQLCALSILIITP